jgi:predicted metal-dependent phosphoesterase TrpH
VQLAHERGISVLGVTDHDTIDGLDEVAATGHDLGIEVVPGVELSTTVAIGEVHMLGYFVNRHDPAFVGALRDLAGARVRRVTEMLAKLAHLGYPVEPERVLADADVGSIGRPHVARELMRIGEVASISEAFDRFLKSGRPAYVPRDEFAPEEAIALLLANGAIPVLAHPFSTRDPEGTVARLVPAGLRGIEVYYAEYTPEQHGILSDLAERWDLLKTGGSDFHGTPDREGRDLGSAPVPESVIHNLRKAASR